MLVMRNCHLPRASALPIIDRTPTRPAGSSRSQSTLISVVRRRRRDLGNWPDSCVTGRKLGYTQFAKYFTEASVLYSGQHIPNDAPQLQTCGNGLRTRPTEGNKREHCLVEDCSASYPLGGPVDYLPSGQGLREERLLASALAHILRRRHLAPQTFWSPSTANRPQSALRRPVPILRNRRAGSRTSWIPHWLIPVIPGRRRVGSLEGWNAVGCQWPQDRDLGGRCRLRRRAAPRGHGKHAGDPVADRYSPPTARHRINRGSRHGPEHRPAQRCASFVGSRMIWPRMNGSGSLPW
jgi:hypothetical protein